MFRHIVLFRWRPEVTAEEIAEAVSAIESLVGVVDEIRSLTVHRDAGVSQGNHDLAIIVEFDDADDYAVYRDHPDHQTVIRERMAPLLRERAALQAHVIP